MVISSINYVFRDEKNSNLINEKDFTNLYFCNIWNHFLLYHQVSLQVPISKCALFKQIYIMDITFSIVRRILIKITSTMSIHSFGLQLLELSTSYPWNQCLKTFSAILFWKRRRLLFALRNRSSYATSASVRNEWIKPTPPETAQNHYCLEESLPRIVRPT